jgi:tetratricopeptide (TPR) repeat protein
LVAFNRIEPFALTRHSKMAEFFRRYGYNADAVAALDKFLEINPNRYDLRNARNFRLCQMGREAEFHDKIKHEFSEAPQLLPGNLQFHVDNIFYLYNYARDFAGADLAAQAYMAIKPVDGRLQRASIEFAKSGDGRLAAAHLAPIDLDLYQGANLANMCCTLAQRYMKYGMIEEAVPLVERAASIDPWRGTVIYAMADLAFARKQYAEAMTHYQRFNERYGRSSLALRGLAKCYSAMGDADRAIRILESDTIDKAPEWANTESVADLMKLYADTGRAERARELADFIPQCAMREREEVKAALEAYRRIDAGRAEAMLGRLNEIMAGPSFWN